jgi:hypothetical protein
MSLSARDHDTTPASWARLIWTSETIEQGLLLLGGDSKYSEVTAVAACRNGQSLYSSWALSSVARYLQHSSTSEDEVNATGL